MDRHTGRVHVRSGSWFDQALADGGDFHLLLAAGLDRYLLRLATNFTARRNQPLPCGEKIHPLLRRYKGKTIPASSPDRVETSTEEGAAIRAEIWEDLILPGKNRPL